LIVHDAAGVQLERIGDFVDSSVRSLPCRVVSDSRPGPAPIMTTTTFQPNAYGYDLPQACRDGAIVARPTTTIASPATTVMGVPLLPGERVVYFYQPSYALRIVALWLLFFLSFWTLIGFVFAYKALTHRRKNPKAQALTTLRVIQVPGRGEPASHWLQGIRDVEAVRQSSAKRGLRFGATFGFLHAMLGLLLNSIELMMIGVMAGIVAGLFLGIIGRITTSYASRSAKTSGSYWQSAVAVDLIGHDGARHPIHTKATHALGFLLTKGMAWGGFDGLPTTRYAA
jgi:hypothetical protein